MKERPEIEHLASWQRIAFGIALAVHIVHLLVGIVHFAAMGQDFGGHTAYVAALSHGPIDWTATNPPGFYLLAWWLRRYVSEPYYVELTALVYLALNLATLWPLDWTLRRLRLSRDLRFAALLVLLFVPFWVIHTLVFAADAPTVPLFLAALFCVVDMLEQDAVNKRFVRDAVALALVLLAAIFTKYSFCFLIAAIGFVFAYETWRRRALFLLLGVAALLPALALGAYEYRRVEQVHGNALYGHHREPCESQSMTRRDLLLPKAGDWRLLMAPEYFDDKLYEPHIYGYWGLLHTASFTDVLNVFQSPDPAVAIWGPERPRESVSRKRHALAKVGNIAAVILSLPLSFLSAAGFLVFGRRSLLQVLSFEPLSFHTILYGFALTLYAPMLLELPVFHKAYENGYWLPRLVMPSLLVFLMLGILLVDGLVRRSARARRFTVAYASVLATAFLIALR